MANSVFYRNILAGFSIKKVQKPIIEELKKHYQMNEYEMPVQSSSLRSVFKNIQFALRNSSSDGINHITGDVHYLTLGLLGKKKILVIHDLVLLHSTPNPLKRLFFYFFWYLFPCWLSDHIVCISQQTQKELFKYCKIPSRKVSVIYNPLQDGFKLKEKTFNKERPRILHIGTNWNKNLPRVISALSNIPCQLIVVGKILESDLSLLSQQGIDYEQKCNLTDAQIIEEYNLCDIVSFPSLYEGFGMPVIEGQSIGRIVVTSAIEPIKEISGGACIFVDPNDIESIRHGFETAIANDALRQSTIEKGIINAQQFSLEKITAAYQNIYNQILQ